MSGKPVLLIFSNNRVHRYLLYLFINQALNTENGMFWLLHFEMWMRILANSRSSRVVKKTSYRGALHVCLYSGSLSHVLFECPNAGARKEHHVTLAI